MRVNRGARRGRNQPQIVDLAAKTVKEIVLTLRHHKHCDPSFDLSTWCDRFESATENQGVPRFDFWLTRRLIDWDDLAPEFTDEVFLRHAGNVFRKAVSGLSLDDQKAQSAFALAGLAQRPLWKLKDYPAAIEKAKELLANLDANLASINPDSVAERLLVDICLRQLVMQFGRLVLAQKPTFDEVSSSIARLFESLTLMKRDAGWDQWNPQNAIPRLVRDQTLHDRLPFDDDIAHELAAVALAESGYDLDSVHPTQLGLAPVVGLRSIAEQSRDLLQMAWLTLQFLKANPWRVQIRMRGLIKVLGRLSKFEYALDNFGRAGVYAWFALRLDFSFVQQFGGSAFSRPRRTAGSDSETEAFNDARGGASPPNSEPPSDRPAASARLTGEHKNLWRIALRTMVDPGPKPPGRHDITSDRSALSRYLRCGRTDMQEIFSLISRRVILRPETEGTTDFPETKTPYQWNGETAEPLTRLIHDHGDEADVRAAFHGAIRTGYIGLAIAWLFGSDLQIRYFSRNFGPNLDASLIRERLIGRLHWGDLLEFADVVSRHQQEVLPVAEWRAFVAVRSAVRKLWKGVEQPPSVPWQELLFLHHAKVGFTHQALTNGQMASGVTGVIYGSKQQKNLDAFLEDYAKRIRYGIRTVGLSEFRRARGVRLLPGEVFVSMVTFEGHIASVLALARNGSKQLQVETVETIAIHGGDNNARMDWNDEIWQFGETYDPQNPIDPDRDASILALGRALVEMVFALEPNVQRILLHCDSIFRNVPWQSILMQNPLRQLRQSLAKEARASRARNLDPTAWDKVIVVHVSGVAVEKANNAVELDSTGNSPVKQHLIVHDESDPICRDFAAALQEETKAFQGLPRLSAVQHGEVRGAGITILMRKGAQMTGEELSAEYAGIPLVLLHACSGSRADQNPLGDLGGLPGFFLSHGVQYLIASPLAVYKEQMLAIERHFVGISRLSDVPGQYYSAIEFPAEKPLTYNLYQGEPVLLLQ